MTDRGTISILGGSGFVGSELCALLCSQGYSIKLFTRNAVNCRHLRVLPSLSIVQINDYTGDSIAPHLEGSVALINLVGILNEKGSDGSGFHRAHVEVTRAALVACEKSVVRRFIQMSALNADANGASHYLRSKGKAENYLNAFSKPLVHTTIFKPSVIFGNNDSFLNRFAQLLKWTPLMFPLACPRARFAPIYVGDLVQCIANAIDDESSYGLSYEICGPNTYSLKELVAYTGKLSGHQRIILGLPRFLSRLQAKLLEFVPGKPFSLDNYRSMLVDSVCSDGIRCTTSIKSIAPTYLNKKRSAVIGQRAHHQSAYT